jgi:hypothetical protein
MSSSLLPLCYGVANEQDPHSQQIIETHSQTFFIAFTVSSAFRVRTFVNKVKY